VLGAQASPPARAELNQEQITAPFEENMLVLLDAGRRGRLRSQLRWSLIIFTALNLDRGRARKSFEVTRTVAKSSFDTLMPLSNLSFLTWGTAMLFV